MTLNFLDESNSEFSFDCEQIARDVMNQVLDDTECPYEATVDVTLTTESEIHVINREHRGIDRATDVLSFPMTQFPVPGEYDFLEDVDDSFDPDSGELMLGDIIISAEHVKKQAIEYGHSERREFAFLVAHSMLHLIGYDHMEPEEAAVMEQKQEEVLNQLGIKRDSE